MSKRRKKQKQKKGKRPSKKRPQQIRHSIDKLPMFSEMIQGMLADTTEQNLTFLKAKVTPHLLDDETVDRAARAYQKQLEYIPLHERQMAWWLTEELTDEQRKEVENSQAALLRLRDVTEANLALLQEIRRGTIDRVFEMDDAELGLAALGGHMEG